MPNRMLLTGASGYLGGTILARLKEANLPPCDIYCLVRNESQKEAVKKSGATAVVGLDLQDQDAVTKFIVENKINIIYFLIDAMKSDAQVKLITGLGELKKQTGQDVYFLHTSGAKIFSEFSGIKGPIADDDPNLYEIQKNAQAEEEVAAVMNGARETNRQVIDKAEEHGVKSFIFIPCIVYGRGGGFGNKISIQTVAVVKAALAAKRVYKVDEGHPTWPVSHIEDTSDLYISILRAILDGQNPPHGKKGYYLASSGSIAWDDLYQAMAKRLYEKGVIESEQVTLANEEQLNKMAEGLKVPSNMVRLSLGGQCSLIAQNGEKIGWKSKYSAQHAVESASDEVDLILENLKA